MATTYHKKKTIIKFMLIVFIDYNKLVVLLFVGVYITQFFRQVI